MTIPYTSYWTYDIETPKAGTWFDVWLAIYWSCDNGTVEDIDCCHENLHYRAITYKVKSHSSDKGNDMADALSKMGSLENNDDSEIFININNKVLDICRSMRMNIIDIEIDWKLSLEIIMKEFRSDISWNSNNECVAFNIKNYLEIYLR
ncbi:hypothetical protein RhiirA1_456581 [Rhizophagus irregularis]|uniref:Uncharacterized protein n=1 Tax=Rhizophagus irregularis TaxID=588596 RepID=A0A2N0S0A4_9GLOM|nr:hypothetical protein RhiirA1_456581 [Rhizophagus irregularis]